MWSHYADSHAGICLELTVQTCESLYQVQYDVARPQFHFADVRDQDRDDDRFERAVIASLTTKAPQWAYEKEWRCIDFGACGERPLPDDTLSGIILGCRMAESDKQMVRDWVESSRRPLKFYQASQREGEFTLDIEEIE